MQSFSSGGGRGGRHILVQLGLLCLLEAGWLYRGVPRMYALFFHRLSILERATDHKCINDCSYSKKECGLDSSVTAL
jgi:hypothetical protein